MSRHRQPPPVERARTKHDAEVERQRVIEEFAASLVAVRVLTYPRRTNGARRNSAETVQNAFCNARTISKVT